ncbi:VanZ family protein [Breoghania sp. L-A4]|uniref:VanZ family protein n=1 Tax=Breoghania sp. L-A4 TaxID=2304600 RepID=UPI000E35A3E2|nr:VanZ family protein [Breoghania sp. L-A4]AXS40302.1 hypothetical protein D1F64_09820 [Breoghania sp. L-A4]
MSSRIIRQAQAFLRAAPASAIASTAFLAIAGIALGVVFSTGLGHPFDKLFHGVFFALLTVSLSGFFGGRVLPAALIAVALGCGGELVQALVPHHEASMADALADIVGVLAAAGVMQLRPSGALIPWHKLGFTDVMPAEPAPIPVRVTRKG